MSVEVVNTRPVTIIDYQPRWQDEFAAIAAPIRAALADLALRIDHIGSTSVPGLAAKDIIDVQLTIASFDDVDAIAEALAPLGYAQRVGEQYRSDYIPPYSTSPASEWEKRYFRESPGQRRVHLHVRVVGRANQRYALLFRDYLRAHLPAADAYADTKRYMAHFHNKGDDPDLFFEIKGPVCNQIMTAAEDWAARTNWLQGASDA
ncbi:MAG: GrpB family protein [Candidatus Poribacteria bacterium]|nr:GrpB family protein [Candidatus Poribacteria bacterium]